MIYHTQCDIIIIGSFGLTRPLTHDLPHSMWYYNHWELEQQRTCQSLALLTAWFKWQTNIHQGLNRFNNISELCIVAVIFIGGRNPEYLQQVTFITYCCIEYTSPRAGFELTTLVVIGTDCIGSCKSNYHMIKTTTVPLKSVK
jgi:hypothetical protein